jgi:hypothetical protein
MRLEFKDALHFGGHPLELEMLMEGFPAYRLEVLDPADQASL